MLHIPTDKELEQLQQVIEFYNNDYIVFRITQTMLDKSTIDANTSIYKLLKNQEVFNFDDAVDGEKYYLQCSILLNTEVVEKKISLYRPEAKPHKAGDPRFWPYGLKSLVDEGSLVFLGVLNKKLILIPLIDEVISIPNLEILFGKSSESTSPQLKKVIDFLRAYKDVWFPSVSKSKKNDKDVGETFEDLLEIPANNSKAADMDGELELKTKRLASKTKDTLFCKVQDKKLSPVKTVRDIILNYGYQSNDSRRPEYIDLFVTVSTVPNAQGLLHKVNRNDEQLEQYHMADGVETLIAVWPFDILKDSLESKHPSTAWIGAEEKKEGGEIFFKYSQLNVTKTPLFQNFLLLIESNKVVFEWRGGQHPVKGQAEPIDYGHAFRVSEKDRNFLFGSSQEYQI